MKALPVVLVLVFRALPAAADTLSGTLQWVAPLAISTLSHPVEVHFAPPQGSDWRAGLAAEILLP